MNHGKPPAFPLPNPVPIHELENALLGSPAPSIVVNASRDVPQLMFNKLREVSEMEVAVILRDRHIPPVGIDFNMKEQHDIDIMPT